MTGIRSRPLKLASFLLFAAATVGCDYSYLQPTEPTSTAGDAATASTPTDRTALTYVKDVRPVLAADCVQCHGPFRRDAGVDLSTYGTVMQTVVPGNANALLILATRRGGPMYGQFSGNASQKATLIHDWIVIANAAQQ